MPETLSTPRRGRPPTGQNGKPVKLYLEPGLRSRAAKHAFKKNKSLSELVSDLLRKRLGEKVPS